MRSHSGILGRMMHLIRGPFTRHHVPEPPAEPRTGEAALAAIERARVAAEEAERQRAEMKTRVELARETRRRDRMAPEVFGAMNPRRPS